ncbi:unnamed protein product [Adineta ricciae]|nr:unnamed protein product [Adineta ricciae]
MLAIAFRWGYRHRRKLPFWCETTYPMLYLLCINLIEYYFIINHSTPFLFEPEFLFQILLSIPLALTNINRGPFYTCIETTLMAFVGEFVHSNLQVISIFIYCFILPIWLLACDEQVDAHDQMANQQNINNVEVVDQVVENDRNVILLVISDLLIYLSVLLPGTYFYGGWFWYQETAFGENIFDEGAEKELFAKLLTVFVVQIMFTVLLVKIIGGLLFNIQINYWWLYILEVILPFIAFPIITLARTLTITNTLFVFGMFVMVMVVSRFSFEGKASCRMRLVKSMTFLITIFVLILVKVLAVPTIILVIVISMVVIADLHLILGGKGSWGMRIVKIIILFPVCGTLFLVKVLIPTQIPVVLAVFALGIVTLHSIFIENPTWWTSIVKTTTLFIAFFTCTLILSISIIYFVHVCNPSSVDQHEWIITNSGLSIADQNLIDNIQWLDFDEHHYKQAQEDLSKIIDKYQSEHVMKRRLKSDKSNKLLGKLYLLEGILHYNRMNFSNAKNSLKKSLEYNKDDIHTNIYMIDVLVARNETNELQNYNSTICKSKHLEAKHAAVYCELLCQIYSRSENSMLLTRLRPPADGYFLKDSQRTFRIERDILIRSFRQWPTHRDLAKLSARAYSNKNIIRYHNWIVISRFNNTQETGYYGIAFRHNQTREIVIAHRGTDIKNIPSLKTDLILFTSNLPEQFRKAQVFTANISQQLEPNKILWHTGHSLGGAIAEFLVANDMRFSRNISKPLSFAVTFDGPGIMEVLNSYYSRNNLEPILPIDFPVISYLSDPNIVNTMGTHIGLVLQLLRFPVVFEWTRHPIIQAFFNVTSSKLFGEYKIIVDFLITHSIEQLKSHSIQSIVHGFELQPDPSGIKLGTQTVIKWPKGIQDFARLQHLELSRSMTRFGANNEGIHNETQYDPRIKQSFYHTIDLSNDIFSILPMTAFPEKVQNFLKYLAEPYGARTGLSQLNTACRTFEMIDKLTTSFFFQALIYAGASSLALDQEFVKFAFDPSERPYLQDVASEVNILTLYTILSLTNSDECIKDNSNH